MSKKLSFTAVGLITMFVPSNVQSDLDRASQTQAHSSMSETRLKERLDLEECLSAFSEKEVLDESNPWYCPVCRKHQVRCCESP